MENECTLLDRNDGVLPYEETTDTLLHWTALTMGTPLVSMLVKDVVHKAPQAEQFGRLLGLARWLLARDVSVLFNVSPPPPGQPPQHGTLLWFMRDHRDRLRASTLNMPQDDAQELWNLPTNRPWSRLIQPEIVRYQVEPSLIPKDNDDRLHAAFVSWMKEPEAPVFFLNCKARDSFNVSRPHILDISTWMGSLTPEDLVIVMGGFLVGARPQPLVDMLDRNNLLELTPGLSRASVAAPSASRIANRQHDLLRSGLGDSQLPAPRLASRRL